MTHLMGEENDHQGKRKWDSLGNTGGVTKGIGPLQQRPGQKGGEDRSHKKDDMNAIGRPHLRLHLDFCNRGDIQSRHFVFLVHGIPSSGPSSGTMNFPPSSAFLTEVIPSMGREIHYSRV